MGKAAVGTELTIANATMQRKVVVFIMALRFARLVPGGTLFVKVGCGVVQAAAFVWRKKSQASCVHHECHVKVDFCISKINAELLLLIYIGLGCQPYLQRIKWLGDNIGVTLLRSARLKSFVGPI